MTDPLLEACRAAPDDDAPRLVWADAVGGERGELVVVQCLLARGDRRPELRRRERDLLDAHGRAWSGLAGIAHACVFHRGFVEAVEVQQFMARAIDDATLDRVFAAAPLLRSLTAHDLGDDGRPSLRRVLARPELRDLEGLDLAMMDANDAVVELLLDHREDLSLRALALNGRASPRAVEALCASGLLASVERLDMAHFGDERTNVADLLAAAPRLRALSCCVPRDELRFPKRIPPSVVELSCDMTGEQLDVLAATPVGQQLERLRVAGYIGLNVESLARFPRLRSLDLAMCSTGFPRNPPSWAAPTAALVRLAMPSLRELVAPAYHMDEAAYTTLADTLGPQLDLLHCPVGRGSQLARSLEAKVAGVLISDDHPAPSWSKQLLLVGDEPPGSWFQRGHVALR